MIPNRAKSNLGRAFETELERSHQYYAVKKLAAVQKNPHSWVFITGQRYRQSLSKGMASLLAKTETGGFMMRSKSDVDYSGTIKGGRSITFDAKATNDTSIALTRFAAHQLDILCADEALGALAGFMCKFAAAGRVFWLPASYVRQMEDQRVFHRGRASISLEMAQGNGREVMQVNGVWDWLEALG